MAYAESVAEGICQDAEIELRKLNMRRTIPDLLSVTSEDTQLRRVSRHRGGEYKGPCPFCGGTKRFRVQPYYGKLGFWRCRDCERSGDVIAYLVETGRIDRREAWELRHRDDLEVEIKHPLRSKAKQEVSRYIPRSDPPDATWQDRAAAFVAEAQERLWSPAGTRALEWLRGRGLKDKTIQGADLGLNNEGDPRHPRCEPAESWGLKDRDYVWLDYGIVIPWFGRGQLWRINVRRPAGTPKYRCVAGSQTALYGLDSLTLDKPVVLVEGEFDALAVRQGTGNTFAGIATGSVTHARRIRWLASLAACQQVLVVFDRDDAGAQARRWWAQNLPNAIEWYPVRHDVSAMLEAGDDIIRWAQVGQERAQRVLSGSLGIKGAR